MSIHKQLFKYILSKLDNNQTPKFYKNFTGIPPMRLIISQYRSRLAQSARFIDHVLQPLVKSYKDYIQNSTDLILRLQDMCIPSTTILVTIDVTSLYQSIPQTECLQIIYDEMNKHQHLILTDPNLIIQLLHVNITILYSPISDSQNSNGNGLLANNCKNIFMSVILHNFLRTQNNKPLLIARCILYFIFVGC